MKNSKILYCLITVIIIGLLILIRNFQKITYTKEFTYLPQCRGMKVQASELAQENKFGNAVYKITGESYDEYLKKYEKILKKDGWKIEKDEKPANIEAKKGDHIVRINVVDSKDSLTVLIWTK